MKHGWLVGFFLAAALSGKCADTNAVVVKPGVRKMAERLQHKIAGEDPMDNTFRNRERAVIMEEKLRKETDPGAIWKSLPGLAQEQLNAGRPKDALATLHRFDEIMASTGQTIEPHARLQLLHTKAICNLRLGEQQNCLTNHTIESCLLPIRSLGVYQRQEGPREAVKILDETLRRYPKDLKAIWLLNIAHMVLGEYPDKVPQQWLVPPKVFESDYDIKHFTDVSSGAGLDVPGWAGGCVVEDFDGDGFLDVMISSWEIHTQLRYFHNNGDGSFAEWTQRAGLIGEVGGLNMVQTDYNNDGLPDVLVLRGAWLRGAGKYPNSLLRNNGDGTFEDVTEEAGLLSFAPTQTAAWFDYNGDGWIDLFIGNESYGTNVFPCELYRNNGDGTFTECAAEAGVTSMGFIKGVVAGDFNNDGRPDLYLSNRGGANFLYRNDGPKDPKKGAKSPWQFTKIGRASCRERV